MIRRNRSESGIPRERGGGMPAHGRRAPRVRLGLAIGPDRVTAVELCRTARGVRPGRARVHPLAPAGGVACWPALTAALRELRRELGVGVGTVDVALLRPLAHAKVLRLPPVRRRELRPLLARNARRYFLAGPEPVVTDARRLRVASPRPGVPVLAACAADSVVAGVARAVAEAGFRVGGITAASAALAEAVASLVGRVRRGRTVVVVEAPGWSERILLDRGAPWQIRPAAPRVRGATPQVPPADAPRGSAEQDFVADRIVTCRAPGAPDAPAREAPETIALLEPMALAAFGAVLLAGAAPQLLPEGLRVRSRRRAALRSVKLTAAAAALLVATGALHLRGLDRELAAVEARRRAVARPVAEAFAARQAVEAVRARLEAIGRAESGRLDWVGVFAGLAEALPDSAYLVALAVEADRLRLEGLAASASQVVPALERSPWFRDVSLAAPVRLDEEMARERFTIALAVEHPVAARLAGVDVAAMAGPGEGRQRQARVRRGAP